MPYTTVMKKLQGQQNINNVTVSAASADAIQDTAEAIRGALRVRHKIGNPATTTTSWSARSRKWPASRPRPPRR